MIENNNPEIDVEEIMAKIRAEIAGQKKDSPPGHFQPTSTVHGFASSSERTEMQLNRRTAEAFADPTAHDLQMVRFPKPVRWLAVLVGRIVVYVSRFLTYRQTTFNQAILKLVDSFERISFDSENRVSKQESRIVELEKQLSEQQSRNTKLEEMYGALNNRLDTDISQLKTDLTLQKGPFSKLLEEARQCLPNKLNEQQLKAFSKTEMHLQDALYVHFGEQFRGTVDDIKARFEVYLPIIRDNNLGTPQTPILDLGCGRGEWLEILKKEKMSAQGIDVNQILVERCREKKLAVIESDVFDHLCSVPDQSLGAVTAFHLVEHLQFDDLVKLLDETLRVLTSGGAAIFETPNPENILVGACNFYHDPTHRNPIPPRLLKFLVESRGFNKVGIMPLNPFDESSRLSDDSSEIAHRFNDFFYGPQDYAVYGFRV